MPAWGKGVTLMLIVLLLTSLVGLTIFTLKATSKTIVVPDDYPTIQDAINHASAGDTVYVRAGNYSVTGNYIGISIDKPISLIGENSQETIISGNPQYATEYYESGGIGGHTVIGISSDDVTVSGFTIDCNGYPEGITFGNSNDKIISNNILNANVVGGTISGSGDNDIISGNSIVDSGFGIGVGGSDNLIANNNITDCNGAIALNSGQNITVSSNNILDDGVVGVALNFLGPFYVSDNNIVNNSIGVTFGVDCSYSEVYNNNILDNQIGVNLLNFNSPNGTYNFVYSNNLINNSENAFVEHAYEYPGGQYVNNGTDVVSWDNGTVGNYWSDYQSKYPNATEIDSSGIGNAPYVIDENNTDYYPLVQQVSIPSIAPVPTISFSLGIWIPPIAIPIFIAALVVEVAIVSLLIYKRHRKATTQK